MNRLGRQLIAACSAWLFMIACAACSADKAANRSHGAKCNSRQEEYKGFCIPKPRSVNDAGASDAGEDAARDATIDAGDAAGGGEDAGPDSGSDAGEDGGTDSGPLPETCGRVGDVVFCYEFSPAATALQLPCKVGMRVCEEDHRWSECSGDLGPEAEMCDGRDNDCDSKFDEAQDERTCTLPGSDVQGACKQNGRSICQVGAEVCQQVVVPQIETCNDVDDDCDGATDEGLEVLCYDDVAGGGCTPNGIGGFECRPASTCVPGTLRCVSGVMQTDCTDDVGPATEAPTTVDGTPLDEDCDGMIDEGIECNSGAVFDCYTGLASTRGRAPCQDGTQMCNVNGEFEACMGEVTPVPETCMNEGTDNDCNGTGDDVPLKGDPCVQESTAKGLCKQNAKRACQGGALVCVPGAMTAEICDGRNEDEDCDGKVDEGINKQIDENNCGACGVRCAAGLTCCGGSCVNTTSSNANCGGCGNACSGAASTCCNSGCVNTVNNGSHCGQCNKACLLGCGNSRCNLL